MITLSLIGIGSGSPDHLTRGAVRAINSADVILIQRKGDEKAEFAALRRMICAEVLANPVTRIVEFDLPVRRVPDGDYLATVDDWHAEIAQAWARAIQGVGGQTERVALLVWGDPSLYDSSLRIARRLNPVPQIEVIPGITAVQALCAAHAIPLNEIGEPFVVTTGRRLRDDGWPAGADTIVVMLDGEASFQTLDPNGVHIWWSAYLGMANELLVSGPLAEAGPRIVAMRENARVTRGWIMDTYILKRISD